MYDLATRKETRVSSGPKDQLAPRISGDKIVWMDQRSGHWNIYMYDASSGTESPLSASPTDQSFPSINGNTVASSDNSSGHPNIAIYDLSNKSLDPPDQARLPDNASGLRRLRGLREQRHRSMAL